MPSEFSSPVDVFKEPRIATLTDILKDLATHLLTSDVAESQMPVVAFEYLCTRHPQLSNYPRIKALESERAFLEKELAYLRHEIRSVVAANHAKGGTHSEVTV